MSGKEKILYGLTLLFFVTFYMPSWAHTINGVLTGLMAAYSLFFYSWKDKWTLLKERRYIAAMVLFFVVVVISLSVSENQDRGWRYLDSRLALCYLPISVGLIHTRRAFRDRVLLGFALVTTLVSAGLLAWGLYRSEFFARADLLYNDSLTEPIERQSIYIALLVTLSIFIYAYHLFYLSPTRWQRIGLAAAAVFLYGISYLLASRSMMILLYTVTLGYVFYYMLQRRRYAQGAALLVTLLLGAGLVFYFFPKTLNRFKELTYTHYDYGHMGAESHYNMQVTADQWNGANFRLAAWSCGWELFKRHPLTGVDLGDKRDELYRMYAEKNFQFGLVHGKNVHSNYLDVLYSMGLIGFVIFMAAWVVLPLLYAWRFRDGLAVLFILTFALAMVTEIYFDRTIGGLAIGFFIPFILSDKREKKA